MDSTTSRRMFLKSVAVAGSAAALPGAAVARAADQEAQKPRRYRISCAAYSYRQYLPRGEQSAPETLFDFIDLCARWDCDATELTSYYFTATDPEYLFRLKRQAHGLGLAVNGTAVGNNFALPPGEALDREIANVKAWVDRALLMGAPAIRIFAGRAAEGLDREKAFGYVTDAIKRCCDYAGEHGVYLGIENHGYLTERAEDLLRIMDKVNHPWLGINLDTGNFVDRPYDNIALAAPKAVTCQVKIELRTEKGDGREPADLNRIVGILRKANYHGYLTLEYEGKEEPKTAIPMWLKRLTEAAAS